MGCSHTPQAEASGVEVERAGLAAALAAAGLEADFSEDGLEEEEEEEEEEEDAFFFFDVICFRRLFASALSPRGTALAVEVDADTEAAAAAALTGCKP
jgi:hypothetical protein